MSSNKQPDKKGVPISDEELARIRDETKTKGMQIVQMKPTPSHRRRKQAEYICSDYMGVYLACIRSGKRNCLSQWHDFNKCVDAEMVSIFSYNLRNI